jgi:hypothetical protein
MIMAFRQYWRNEVEGQGIMPIWAMSESDSQGKSRGPSVQRFYPEGDEGLYLKYQEFLHRELASAFDISPQNLGVERDLNRNTSETAEDRDRQQAIKPYAHLLESHITREAIHAKLGFSQLKFQFVGIEQEDEEALAKTYEYEYKNNALTPNEYRERRGMEPMDNDWGDKTFADMEIAISAARGSKVVDDPDIASGTPKPSTPKKPKSSSNKN